MSWNKKYKKFALALGGGAARWIAHIGLIRRLEEYGIQPEIITGTSMGSIIGALYALGVSSEDMTKISKSVKMLRAIDLNPFTDILKRSAIKKAVELYIGDKTFADTKIPLRIIATDIESGETFVFEKGKIMDAILASSSIPGVFSPYEISGKYYIDGGATENLPLSSLGDMPVIASSVLLPRGKDISKKSFLTRGFSVVHGAYTIMLQQQESMTLAFHKWPCHLISLSNKDVDYMDFRKTKKLIEETYEQSKEIDTFISIPKK